jgi:hypothetical protein
MGLESHYLQSQRYSEGSAHAISQMLLFYMWTWVVSVCLDGDRAHVSSNDVEEDTSRDMS